MSGIHQLHKQLGLIAEAVDSFPVVSVLRVADLSMKTPPICRLPILPHLLIRLCLLCSSLGKLGPAIKVCQSFGFFGIFEGVKPAPHPPHAQTVQSFLTRLQGGCATGPTWPTPGGTMNKDAPGSQGNTCYTHTPGHCTPSRPSVHL